MYFHGLVEYLMAISIKINGLISKPLIFENENKNILIVYFNRNLTINMNLVGF